MRELVVYTSAFGFAFGVAVASVWSEASNQSALLVLVGAALVIVALRHSGHKKNSFVLASAIFCLLVPLGFWRAELYTNTLYKMELAPVNETIEVTGVVTQEPEARASNLQFFMMIDEETILVTTDRYQNIRYGDVVSVTGRLEQPSSFTTDLGREFNYPGYLAARGVTQVTRYADVNVIERNAGNPVIGSLLVTKAWFLEHIEKALPEPHAGLAQGLLLGVKRALGNDLEHVFRSTGIIHIVVLSGYNIMLVVAFVLYVLSFVLPWRGRLVFGLLAIVGFAIMVGLGATVVRASIMAGLALVARAFGRTYTVVRALLIAGLVMLLINPYLLVFDVGFQLSFLATLGLIVVAPHLEQRLTHVTRFLSVREFLVATLATQLFVLPILLYQIGEFSVVSVIVNILVLPMVPVAMLSTFILVLLSAVAPAIASVFVWVPYFALSYIVVVPSWFASLPFAAFEVPPFPFWLVPLAYGVIGYGLYRLHNPSETTLTGWTIEEEAGPQSEAAVISESTPVFFR